MTKISIIFCVYLFVVIVEAAPKSYFPQYNDPDRIYFNGKTNYEGNEIPGLSDKDSKDYIEEPIDIRGKDGEKDAKTVCPRGYTNYGDMCFPNDWLIIDQNNELIMETAWI